ncbi:hypothetical protein [Arabiibacter massiliensis]|uniref:hypothetical protein n=1 Tax=Arabiibacter massiliensis TaxID=1870985 RepID=UPI0009B9497D|nr:hypothetical protein [Arabiibacter massiliensis]
MVKKLDTALFDWELYGLLVRKARIDMGYKKAEDFAESVWRRTRVRMSRDILYKIEQGRQIPDASQFMALNLAVSDSLFYPDVTDMCTSRSWKQIAGGDGIPDEWKKENSEEAWAERTGMRDARDLEHMPAAEEARALLSEKANDLANDRPELFDSGEADSDWHNALETYLAETYGPDAQD